MVSIAGITTVTNRVDYTGEHLDYINSIFSDNYHYDGEFNNDHKDDYSIDYSVYSDYYNDGYSK